MSRKKISPLKTPEICPVCGEDVPNGAVACPECGADHNSGWREELESYDATGLPEEDFDYNEFVRREFGRASKPAAIKTVWWVTAILVIVAVAAFCLYGALR
jgi:ssDNA-binding Zn-finger/Zn-ribbon topoisomerase 1